MRGSVRVLAGMPVRRTIAAERDAALLARAQMYPGCPDLHTFLAFAALRLFDRSDRLDMRAGWVRHYQISLFRLKITRNAVVDATLF